MLDRDEETARELAAERTDEELAEVLSSYGSRWFSWWRVLLGVLVLVSVGLMMGSCVEKGERLREYLGYGEMMDLSEDSMEVLRLAAEKRKSLKLKRWESDKTNKSYFMDYVVTSFDLDVDSIEDVLENAERVDPGNSYYYYLAAIIHTASHDGTTCVKKIKSARPVTFPKERGLVEEWEVLNREQYEESLSYIKKAGEREGILNRTLDFRFSKLVKFREMKEEGELDWLGERLAMSELVMDDNFSMKMMGTSRIFSTKFYELSQNGSEVEVRFWIDEYVKLVESLLSERGLIVDVIVAKALMMAPVGNMRAAAERAGMTDVVENLTKYIDQLNADEEAREVRWKMPKKERDEFADEEYSRDAYLMHEMGEQLLRYVKEKDQVVLTSSKAGRLGDHAFIGKLFVLLICTVLVLIVLGMWVFFFARRREMRVMSMQALGALMVMDGVMILLVGVVFPVVLYVVVNEWMALGLSVRDWSVVALSGAMVLLQFVGMVVTVLTLSMALLHWRLSVRLPGLVSRVRGLSWVLPGLSFSAMILVGMTDAKSDVLPWVLAGGFLSLAFLGWVVLAGVGAFRKKEELLRVAMCRGVLTVYSCALVVFVSLYFYYASEERYWVSQSEDITFKEELLGVTTIEYRVAQQMRRELEERLELIR